MLRAALAMLGWEGQEVAKHPDPFNRFVGSRPMSQNTSVALRVKPHPSQMFCRLLFDYDNESGRLIWKHRDDIFFASHSDAAAWNTNYAGNVAGHRNADGYIHVCIFGSSFKSHRLVWIWHNGEIPFGIEIDHIHGVETGDYIENLRLATHSVNAKNARGRKDNTSGYCGVTLHKQTGKWTARLWIRNERVYLGLFSSPEEANEIIKSCRNANGYTARHGEKQ